MIAVSNLRVTYQVGAESVHALDGVSLHIERGEFVAIIGTSGSGKSTLLNVLGCLCRPTSGGYRLAGREVAQLSANELAATRNREIGFVFQSFQLLPRLTALDNVALPLIYRGVSPRARRQRAEVCLHQVGLGERLLHRPTQLSGGQRQRVAIARALVGQPSLILADEPTGSLDSASSSDILTLLTELHGHGHTVVMVTHDAAIAAAARRSIQVQDGRIVNDQARAA